ncbi:MAG TPA: FtsX-like permease family protein, partial [Acidobacteriota bacterium]|nr:FtsX-like permease family protein [Acidobacteriota bacterium]
LLAFAGAALGAVLSLWTVDLIMGMAPSDISLFQLNTVRVDQRVLLFSAAMAALTGIVFGLLPALKVSKPDLLEALKHGSRSGSAQSSRWVRSGLVTAEVALSLVLLVGAGLLMTSFLRLLNVGTGLGTERILSVSLTLDSNRYPDRAQQDGFFQQLARGAESLPGVEAASMGSGVPPDGGGFSFGFGTIEIEGQEAGEPDYNQMLPYYTVGPDYFQVLGIPILKGRSFGPQDTPESPRAVIINQAMARRYWGQDDPLGDRMRVGSSGTWRTVVGVARDVKSFGLDNPYGDLAIYYPYSQQPNNHRKLIVRTAGQPESVIDSLRQLIWTIDEGQPIHAFQTYDDLVAETLTSQRFYLTLFMVFAGLALFLAAFGIYGVVSYSVTERTHEIGVRMAVGAGRSQVLRLVVRQGMLPVGLGIAIGLVSALGLSRYIESWLYEVQPTDPWALASVVLTLSLVALAACLLPARRATRVDPIIALRAE